MELGKPMSDDEREAWLDSPINGKPMYYHRDGTPAKTRREGMAIFAAKWEDGHPDNARIAEDTLRYGTRVSTVFLVLDHAFKGPPMIFETMIFGGPLDGDTWRYGTEKQAVKGHAKALHMARENERIRYIWGHAFRNFRRNWRWLNKPQALADFWYQITLRGKAPFNNKAWLRSTRRFLNKVGAWWPGKEEG